MSKQKHNVEKVVYENGCKYVIIDGLKYTNGGSRLTYTPEIHDNHKKYWTEKDKAYLVQMRLKMNRGYSEISAALGRTYGTCADKFLRIKKKGEIDKYLSMDF